jgi:RNA polymerase sigma factor (sigma-70 family)
VRETDDKELIGRLADPATRERAFAELVKLFSQPLYWQIRRLVLSHDDANDVLQNTFLKAWTNLDSFQGKSQLSTWLYRIAINEAIDFLRRKRKSTMVDIDEDPGVANMLMGDEYFDGDQAQALLQQAIAKLPDVQRAVFNLRYYDDMKYSEMSELLGTSVGALKASYHIAVTKIKEELEKSNV